MDIDVILFDWGGTLAQVVRQDAHLRRGLERAVRLACEPYSAEALEDLTAMVMHMEQDAAVSADLREADFGNVFNAWAEKQSGTVKRDRLPAMIDVIGREWIGSLDPFPESAAALRALREADYRIGVVSNCMIPPEYCRQELDRQGLGQLVDFLIVSSGVGYRKPSPKIYEAALAAAYPLGRPRDLLRALFVGDSPPCDIVGPAALGMRTALVACKKGLWSAEEYAQARPDFRLDSIAELPNLLAE